jgi:hypothetical protein
LVQRRLRKARWKAVGAAGTPQTGATRLAEAKGLKIPEQNDYSLAEMYFSRAENNRLGLPQLIGFA